MASIPGWLLRHEVTVEPYEGESASGPVFGDARTVACFIDDKRQLVRSADGEQVVSSATLYTRLDEPFTTRARVTVRGKQADVLSVARRDGGGLPTPDHLEVQLK